MTFVTVLCYFANSVKTVMKYGGGNIDVKKTTGYPSNVVVVTKQKYNFSDGNNIILGGQMMS